MGNDDGTRGKSVVKDTSHRESQRIKVEEDISTSLWIRTMREKGDERDEMAGSDGKIFISGNH